MKILCIQKNDLYIHLYYSSESMTQKILASSTWMEKKSSHHISYGHLLIWVSPWVLIIHHVVPRRLLLQFYFFDWSNHDRQTTATNAPKPRVAVTRKPFHNKLPASPAGSAANVRSKSSCKENFTNDLATTINYFLSSKENQNCV